MNPTTSPTNPPQPHPPARLTLATPAGETVLAVTDQPRPFAGLGECYAAPATPATSPPSPSMAPTPARSAATLAACHGVPLRPSQPDPHSPVWGGNSKDPSTLPNTERPWIVRTRPKNAFLPQSNP